MTVTRKYQVAILTAALALCAVAGGLTVRSREACAAQAKLSFSEDVLPILKGRCVSCHQSGGEGYEKSGLDLTSYEGLMKGNKFGPMVVPGDPDSSNLVQLLEWRASPELRMPHGKKQLSTCDRKDIWTWIFQGAKNN